MKHFFFLSILITFSNCTVSKPTQDNQETSKIVIDTLFENLACRNLDYTAYIDSCLINSDYLETTNQLYKRKVIYRDVKAIANAMSSDKSDSLTAKVCFNAKGIAVQALIIKSTYSDKVSKKFLMGFMNYRVEPLTHSESTCPDCGLFNIRSGYR